MQQYRSHKIVEAGKIGVIDPSGRYIILVHEGETVKPSDDWWTRYEAATETWVGGYFVRYTDGYESWSPAQAFEDGYTELK